MGSNAVLLAFRFKWRRVVWRDPPLRLRLPVWNSPQGGLARSTRLRQMPFSAGRLGRPLVTQSARSCADIHLCAMRRRLRPLRVICRLIPTAPAAGPPTPAAISSAINPTPTAVPILSILDKIFHCLGKVLVGWHGRRFGYAWKQRDTRGRCKGSNGNNSGAANHAAQKSAAI